MTTAVSTQTAVGYFRVSTEGQAGERHVSLEVQRQKFEAFCRSNGLVAVNTFTDVASGRKDNRPQYQAMLRYIVQYDVGNVVVLFLDRFGRTPRELLRRYWELQERGTTVVSINEDLREELMLLIRAGIAGQESKRTSERVSMALRQAAQKGKVVVTLPYGYIKVKKGTEEWVEQVPKQVEALRLAYRLCVEENAGLRAIADKLNGLGYRGNGGGLFAAQSVKLFLRNPVLTGQSIFKGEVVKEDAFPPILTAEEWRLLQERLNLRGGRRLGKSTNSLYLLSGLLRCGACGGAMAGAASGPGRYKYYVCCNMKGGATRCNGNIRHRREHLEDAVLGFLAQYRDPERVRELLAVQEVDRTHESQAELTRVTARQKELETAFLADLDRVDRKVMTEAEYLKRQEVRRTEQATLQARKTALEATVAIESAQEAQIKAVPARLGSFLDNIKAMPVAQAKGELQGIVKRITVYSDGRLTVEFRQ